MKQVILTLILLLSLNFIWAQKFTYKRVITTTAIGSDVLKIKGDINLTDSIITITTNGVDAPLRVNKTQDFTVSKTYILIQPENSDYETRFTFTQSPFSKKEDASLIIETRDNFTNTLTTLIYPLISFK